MITFSDYSSVFNKMKYRKTVLGIMSGTSLDGLDYALCSFEKTENNFSYRIIKTGFFPYNNVWKKQLSEAQNLNTYHFRNIIKNTGNLIFQIRGDTFISALTGVKITCQGILIYNN